MQVPIEQGRAELTANRFRRDDRQDDSDGEWWVPEAGHPSLLLQYVGQNKDCFDRDQLDHVLDWGLWLAREKKRLAPVKGPSAPPN